MISQEEITEAFNRIDSSSTLSDIDELVTMELYETHELAPKRGEYVLGICKKRKSKEEEEEERDAKKVKRDTEMNKDKIKWACKEEFRNPDNRAKIAQILKNNPNVTKNTLEIVQLVAPAVAQVLGGIPALAIVGTIIILIKQGFLNNIGIS